MEMFDTNDSGLKVDVNGVVIPRPRVQRRVANDRVTVANIQSWKPGITGFIQYYRTGVRNTVRGIVVAQYDHNTNSYRIGWAMCDPNDNNDIRRGLAIAFGRLNVNKWVSGNAGFDISYYAYIPASLHPLVFNRLINMHNQSVHPSERVDSRTSDANPDNHVVASN